MWSYEGRAQEHESVVVTKGTKRGAEAVKERCEREDTDSFVSEKQSAACV